MRAVADVALIILSFGFVAVVGGAAWVTWRTVRMVRRWRRRLGQVAPQLVAAPAPEVVAGAWSHLHRTTLAARAMTGTGWRRQVLRLRHDLWTRMDAAEAAVRSAGHLGTPVGRLPDLLAHLADQARRHDHMLVLVAKGAPVMDLDTARAETARIIAQADQVSGAVAAALRSDAVIDPGHLATALDHETEAVSHGSERARSLTR